MIALILPKMEGKVRCKISKLLNFYSSVNVSFGISADCTDMHVYACVNFIDQFAQFSDSGSSHRKSLLLHFSLKNGKLIDKEGTFLTVK